MDITSRLSKKDIKTRDMISEAFYLSDNYLRDYREIWKEAYRLYKGILKENEKVGKNYIFIPVTYSVVQTILSRLLPAVLTGGFGEVVPVGRDDVEGARMHTEILKVMLDRQKIFKPVKSWLHNFVLYGNGIMKLIPRNLRTRNYTVDLSCVDNFDFYPDPYGKDIEDCEYVIHRYFLSGSRLKKFKGDGIHKNINLALETKTTGWQSDTGVVERRGLIGIDSPTSGSNYKYIEGRPYEILEFWTDDRIVQLVNRQVVIMDEENIYKRKLFVKIDNMDEAGEFWSTGDVKEVGPQNIILNRLKQQRFDNVELVLHRQWLVLRDAGVDIETLVSAPGAIHFQDIPNSIEPLLTPDVTSSSYQEEQVIKFDIQQISGVVDVAQGITGQALSSQTATGINMLQEAANQRFKQKLVNISLGQADIINMLVELNTEFMPDEVVIEMTDNITGENITEVFRREQLRGNYSFKGLANLFIENKAILLQKWLNLYSVFANDPEVNTREIKKNIFNAAEVQHLDSYLKSEEEVRAMQEAQAQQQQQMLELQEALRRKQMADDSDKKMVDKSIENELELDKERRLQEIKGGGTEKKK